MYYLRTFGGLRLERDGNAVTGAAAQRSRLSLLAVIAAAGERGISRDSLQALLWPDKDQAGARGALKQAIYALRRDLGADLFSGEPQLSLNPEVVSSDIGAYYDALARGDLERAASLCDGVFLEGVHLPGGEFDLWLDAQRARVTSRLREALTQLATSAEEREAFADAVRWWRALASADPLSARVACSLMLALAKSGDRSAALEHARFHERVTRAELDAPPDASVLKLAEAIRRDTAGDIGHRGDIALETSTGVGAPDPAVVAVRPSGRPRAGNRRWRWAGIASLGAATAFLALGPAGGSLDDGRVELVAHGPSGHVVTELAAALGERDRSLEVSANAGTPTQEGLAGTRSTRRIGARWIVTLTTTGSPDLLRLTAHLHDAATGSVLGSAETVALGDRAPDGVGLLADRIAITLATHRSPIFSNWGSHAAIPRTWQGFQQLEKGIRSFAAGDATAIEQFRSAAALDSTSATPVLWEAFAASHWGRQEDAGELVDSLEHSARRFGPWDRAMSTFLKAGNRSDLAHDAGHALLRVVPGSAWAVPVALRLLELGRAQEAAALLQSSSTGMGWADDWQYGWAIRDAVLHTLGDYEAELRTAREARRRFPDSRLQMQSELKALAALGRVTEVEESCAQAMSFRPVDDGANGWDWQPCGQVLSELRAHGHPAAARRLGERLLVWRRETGPASPEAEMHDRLRVLEALGDWQSVEALLLSPVARAVGEVEAQRLWALVFAGRGAGAAARQASRHFDVLAAAAGLSLAERSFERAHVHALLGDREGTLALLAIAFANGFGGVRRLVHLYPAFDGLWGDQAFETIVRPPEASAHLTLWRQEAR